MIDADEIIPGLWQGARPPSLPINVQVVVFTAQEYQPKYKPSEHRQHLVIYAPFDDTFEPTGHDFATALRAGNRVASLLQDGRRCLVTCFEGRNRSGLVNGIALIRLGIDPREAVMLIQSKRRDALTNPAFVKFLMSGVV